MKNKAIFMPEEPKKQLETEMDFNERQNATGFFSVLLGVVLRNPELRKKVFDEKNEDKNG